MILHRRQDTKKATLDRSPFDVIGQYWSGAAGTLGTAAGASGAEVDARVQFETIHVKIHLNGLCFFQKFRVNDKFKVVNVEGCICVGKLIQSHGQAGAPSAALIEENPDGLDILSFEIFGNLLNCRLRYLEHNTLLGN